MKQMTDSRGQSVVDMNTVSPNRRIPSRSSDSLMNSYMSGYAFLSLNLREMSGGWYRSVYFEPVLQCSLHFAQLQISK